MGVQFELTLRITGDSLDQVDDGLIKAAGERLKARIHAKAAEKGPITMPAGLKITPFIKPETIKPEKEASNGEEKSKKSETSSETCNEVIKGLFQSIGRERAHDSLAHFSAETVRDIPAERMPEFISYLETQRET